MAGTAFWRHATPAFAAGALGGLVLFVFYWIIGTIGIPQAIGLNVTANVTKAYLYNRIVWGGIWGFLFLIPWKASWWLRGLVFSLGPTAALWFIIYPYVANAGILGLGRGILGPFIPIIGNGVWGLVAAWWLEFVGARAAVAS